MRQDYNRETWVMKLGQQLRRGPVRQVSSGTGNSPLHDCGIITGPQLYLVVVRLENDRGEITEQITYCAGRPTEVVGHTETGAFLITYYDRQRLGSIVTGRTGLHREGSYLRPGAKSDGPMLGILHLGCKATPGSRCGEHRDPEPAGQQRCSARVVTMLVSEGDANQASRIEAGGNGAALHLAGAEAGIDQEYCTICLHRTAVPP
jgi:hypothetical protein